MMSRKCQLTSKSAITEKLLPQEKKIINAMLDLLVYYLNFRRFINSLLAETNRSQGITILF